MLNAMSLIKAERERQIKVEGWTDAHDNENGASGELEAAARFYINAGENGTEWPWITKPKLKDERANLIRAGALLLAEIDRLKRKQATWTTIMGFAIRNETHRAIERVNGMVEWVACQLRQVDATLPPPA